MNSRQRVKNAMHYQPVDKVPVQYSYSPVGFYEHGEKLNDLFAANPGDFDAFSRQPIPAPPASEYDTDGNYHSFRTDEWGVTWEYRIFGIAGIPCQRPIQFASEMDDYVLPKPPATSGKGFQDYASGVRNKIKAGYYTLENSCNLYERMIALYGDENVLCDIALDEPEIGRLADRIIEYDHAMVIRAVQAGADGIAFGDDYGTEKNMIMSPECWRRFFKPRLKKLFQPAVDAGLDIHFHSCGKIMPILKDLREIGVTSIWPQLPAYNMRELAAHCRDLGLATAIHTDRAKTMVYGTPDDVRKLVQDEFEVFQMMDGGGWFYVEVDNGFPFANIEALAETIAQWR